MKTIDTLRIDRKTVRIGQLTGESQDKQFWHSRTPQERLQILEVLRSINYGYDEATERLQRIFAIAQQTSS